MVHAPERAAPRVRVGLQRCRPAGARLGGLAGIRDRAQPDGVGDLDFLGAGLSQAAAQLHLVGEPQGRRRQQRLRGGLPRARQHRGLRPDRSRCPAGCYLEQADGTGWMAMYCLNLLAMALELARHDSAYEDVASKFFEHFLFISTPWATRRRVRSGSGTRRTASSTTSYGRVTAITCGCRCVRWWGSSLCLRWRRWNRRSCNSYRNSSAAAMVLRVSAGGWCQHRPDAGARA